MQISFEAVYCGANSDSMTKRIQVENLSKCYRIGHVGSSKNGAKYRMLRDVLIDAVKAPIRNLRSGAALGKVEEFWALRDINFEVNQGEALAIVGRNGAGKSTLLKVLTQITTPTRGQATLHGRVGSLLEVGTGFHPELTGRENVFLNGSILGMGRQEIKSQFDQIVDFAGIQRFIDTPVKRYSSGMKVRLGFAVAAHLDLEILLVDEVLAVGDAEFQRKCMGKMDEVAHSGRTVLFVSHNMTAVQNLCPRAILLEAGQLVMDGPSGSVVERYLASFGTLESSRDLTDPTVPRTGTGEVRVEKIELLSHEGDVLSAVLMGEGIRIRIKVRAKSDVRSAYANFVLSDSRGDIITVLHGNDSGDCRFDLNSGEEATVECMLPQMNLHPGMYAFNASLRHKGANEPLDRIERAVSFEILPADVFGTGKIPSKAQKIFLASEWSVATAGSSKDPFRGA